MLLDHLRRTTWPLSPVLCLALVGGMLPPRLARAQDVPAEEPAAAEPPAPDATAGQSPSPTTEGAASGSRPTTAVANARTDRDAPAGTPESGDGTGDGSGDGTGTDAAPDANGDGIPDAEAAADLPGIDGTMPRVNAALPTGDDKSGVTSKSISLPQGAGKIAGMGESFSAQLSTGIATFSVPFAIPGGRGGAQPSLGLSYSSGGGNGDAGLGWSVGVPFIARQTDRGLPLYDDRADWHPNQDRFVFNGGQELVPVCRVTGMDTCAVPAGAVAGAGPLPGEAFPAWAAMGGGWQYFRPRVEGSFLRFFWSPDHRTWRVQDKSGVTMELGAPLDGSGYAATLEANPTRPAEIYRWHLARQYDTYGAANTATALIAPHNVVVYRYQQDGGMAYLSDIYSTTPASEPATTDLGKYAHHVRLAYEVRPDASASFRSGWQMEHRQRLVRVDVTSKSFAGAELSTPHARRLVRRYHLAYDPDYHASLLTSVTVEGRCAGAEAQAPAESASGALAETTGCGTLPPMTFRYNHVAPFTTDGAAGSRELVGYEGFDERIRAVAGSPPHSLDEQLSGLFDIDSDGLPDVLVTAPGLYGDGHGVFFNGPSGQTDAFAAAQNMALLGVLGANATTIKLSNLNLAPLDLDGDGIIDLLHMPKVKTYSVYTPNKQGTAWRWVGREITTASQQNPKIDFGNDTLDVQVLDANGDGLVDVVATTGTELQTFFSLGRYREGDGQFGAATWQSATAANLSNDPVTTCVPWSAQPVRFSDPDVKLADMNGDGLVDIVRVRRGDIIYWPGRGNGFWGTGDRDDCPAGTFGADRHVTMATAPYYSDIQGTTLRMDDVNGDGLDDLVQVRFDAVDVFLNVDGTAWTDRHIIDATPPSPSYANRVRLVDINGSGTRDILWGDATNYRYIDLQGGQQPGLLVGVENGLGKTTTVEYSTSTAEMLAARTHGSCTATAQASDPWSCPWATTMPSVTHVVKRVTESAGLANAPPVVTEYSYRDPVYEGRQREFRGFARAKATRLGDQNSPTDVTETTFLLGECQDPTPDDGVDQCGSALRALDNPYEALKGLPVLTEKHDLAGVTLATTHTAYELRELYLGLDGRRVMHAVQTTTDGYAYDTASFTPSASSVTLPDATFVRLSVAESSADNPLVPQPGVLRSSAVPIRSAAHAHTRSSASVDPWGNQTVAVAQGCVDGPECLSEGGGDVDETITAYTEACRPANEPTGWLWRTCEAWTEGEDGDARGHTRTTYDEHGNPVTTEAELDGAGALDRSRAGGGPVAPTPAGAAVDGWFLTSFAVYHTELGVLTREHGASGDFQVTPCRDISFAAGTGGEPGDAYFTLPVSETIYTGSLCTGLALATRVTEYDRGLGAIVEGKNIQGQPSRVEYDEFGRVTASWAPHPTAAGGLSPLPSVLIDYDLATVARPWSIIHTQAQDGATLTDAQFLESYAFVDGFGRTLATLSEADPTTGPGGGNDGGQWVVGGLLHYDAKSAVRRKYIEYFSDAADPRAFQPPMAPPTPYGSQRYDAFGRQVQTYDVDGTVTLQSVYHALSTDLHDAADLQPGPHQGSYASTRSDGHGRSIRATERVHVNGAIEARHIETTYLATGEPVSITRRRGGATGDAVTRWMRYDTLGRMVLNVEPNTSAGFDPSPAADASVGGSLKAWRYVYDNQGALVGTSDARGCGVNFTYDAAGRLLGEDYSPCESWHPAYTAPAAGAIDGYEVAYVYDALPAGLGVSEPAHDAAWDLGRLTATYDRSRLNVSFTDGRGRVIRVASRIALPAAQIARSDIATRPLPATFATRYTPRWYQRQFTFDAADRNVTATTGAVTSGLIGPLIVNGSRSVVQSEYSRRGTLASVKSTYSARPLVAEIHRTADGLTTQIQYGDLASTTTATSYDDRRRPRHVMTYRSPPTPWTTSPPPTGYSPAPAYSPDFSSASTFQLLLQDDEYTYDVVGNPIEIHDYRIPEEWPAGAKPVSRKIQYDDLNRAIGIDYAYSSDDARDPWTSPYKAEVDAAATTSTTDPLNGDGSAAGDRRRPLPSPHVSFTERTTSQTWQYDWLGNTAQTGDDAGGFYDRSLGTVENGPTTGAAYQLRVAQGTGTRGGRVATKYDDAGNLTRMELRRDGPCLISTKCSATFHYQWDEVGRLARARRWDRLATEVGNVDSALPTGTPGVDLRYLYDTSDQRTLKTSGTSVAAEVHTAYIFESFELRRTAYLTANADYTLSAWSGVPYLTTGGVRLARVFWLSHANVPLPDLTTDDLVNKQHVLLELGDHLGSNNLAIDLASGELVERSTFYGYGATEGDYRPGRWGGFREDYKFTGKEEDQEVGLQYFGKRYLNPYLGRWVSADPLGVHALGADPNLYAYVSGFVLKSIDPVGLCGNGGERCDPSTGASGQGSSGPDDQADAANAADSAYFQSLYAPTTHEEREAHAAEGPVVWFDGGEGGTEGQARVGAEIRANKSHNWPMTTQGDPTWVVRGPQTENSAGGHEGTSSSGEPQTTPPEPVVAQGPMEWQAKGERHPTEQMVLAAVDARGAAVTAAVRQASRLSGTARAAPRAAPRGGESAAAAAGRRAHGNYGTALGSEFDTRVTLPSGRKPDAVNWAKREVRELKPDNARAERRGQRQVEGYRKELEEITGESWTSEVDTYRAGGRR